MFGSGFIAGFMLASLFAIGLQAYKNDGARSECEENLKRTEKCVKVWVPEVSK